MPFALSLKNLHLLFHFKHTLKLDDIILFLVIQYLQS